MLEMLCLQWLRGWVDENPPLSTQNQGKGKDIEWGGLICHSCPSTCTFSLPTSSPPSSHHNYLCFLPSRSKPSLSEEETTTPQPPSEEKPSLVPVRRSARLLEKGKQQKEETFARNTNSTTFLTAAKPREARSSGCLREVDEQESISTPRRSARIRSASSLAESLEKGSSPSSSTQRFTSRKRPRASPTFSPTPSPLPSSPPPPRGKASKGASLRRKALGTQRSKEKAKLSVPTSSLASPSGADQEGTASSPEDKKPQRTSRAGNSNKTSPGKRKRGGQKRETKQSLKSSTEVETDRDSLPTPPARKKRKTTTGSTSEHTESPKRGLTRSPSKPASQRGNRRARRQEEEQNRGSEGVDSTKPSADRKKKRATSLKGKASRKATESSDSEEIVSVPRRKAKVLKGLSETQPSRGKGKSRIRESKELGSTKGRSKGKGKGLSNSLKGKGRAALSNR